MTEPTLFQIAVYAIILITVISIPIYLIWKRGNQNAINAKEYDRRYIFVDKLIENFEVDKLNYDFISRALDGIRELKYKDTRRTKELIDKFNAKFEPEASRIMKEHLKPE